MTSLLLTIESFLAPYVFISMLLISVQQTVVAPSDCLACSILNLLFCNLLFGAIAVGMSCAARSSFDRGESWFIISAEDHYFQHFIDFTENIIS